MKMNRKEHKIRWWLDTYRLEQHLVPVIARIEQAGVKVDLKGLKGIETELLQIQSDLLQVIHKILGTSVNLNSNEQLSTALLSN